MRFAYLITLHHKAYQFEWLLNALYNPEDLFLIHIDLKTLSGLKKNRRGVADRVRALIADKPNIRMMRPRYSNWGGWSLSRLALLAIDELLDHDSTWTHFINLSGQCYPTKTSGEIRSWIASAGEDQFIELIPFQELSADDWHLRRALMIETPVRAFALPIPRRPPRSCTVDHKGAQWVILTRAFCEWQQSARVRRDIIRYLAYSHLSDELIFQTLLLNGPYRERVTPHYGRSIVWPGPKVMKAQDIDFLRNDHGLFGRKFDAAVDGDVLAALAESGGYRPGPPAPS